MSRARRLLGPETRAARRLRRRRCTRCSARSTSTPSTGSTPIAMLDGLNATPRIDDGPARRGRLRARRRDQVRRARRGRQPERVIIDRNEFVAEQVIGMIDTCRRLSIKVSILPDAVESLGPSVEVDDGRGRDPARRQPADARRAPAAAIKRGFDLVDRGRDPAGLRAARWRWSRSRSSSTRRGPVLFARRASAAAAGASGCSSSGRWAPTPRSRHAGADGGEPRPELARPRATTRGSPGSAASCAAPASTSCRSSSTCSAAR